MGYRKDKQAIKEILKGINNDGKIEMGCLEEIPTSKRANDIHQILEEKMVVDKPVDLPTSYFFPSKKTNFKIMAISDTHIGSKYSRIDYLKKLYKLAEKLNIDFIVHCGDILAGVHFDQKLDSDLIAKTFHQQLELFAEVYPQSYIPTYMISGNRDQDQFGNKEELEKYIQKYRQDLKYLGNDRRFLTIGPLKMELLHKSSMSGKNMDSLKNHVDDLQNDLVNIIFRGHYHKFNTMDYNNTLFAQIPCLFDNPEYHLDKIRFYGLLGALFIDCDLSEEFEYKTQFMPLAQTNKKTMTLSLKKESNDS